MIPVILAVAFYLLQHTTSFGSIKPWIQNVLIGVAFGIVAMYGTAFGVDVGGAAANARDAAPLCAGLFFSGPAGLIAGLIGGVYRWIAAEAFGVGVYTKVACSVSTAIAGVYAAAIRELVFEKRNPKWYTAFLIGVIIESFHMLMVFLTHIGDTGQALEIIKIVTFPMILVNAFAIGFTAGILEVLNRVKMHHDGEHYIKEKPTISERIQLVLLIIVVLSFLLTSSLSYLIQTEQTQKNVGNLLRTDIQDMVDDISDITDGKMIDIAVAVAKEYNSGTERPIDEIAKWYGLTEIHVVGSDGFIKASTNGPYEGYNMKNSGITGVFMELCNSNSSMVKDYVPHSDDDTVRRKYAGASTNNGGFVLVGVNDAQLQDKISSNISSFAKNRHIGNTGSLLIVDSQNRILSCPEESFIGRNLMTTGLWIWDNFEPGVTYKSEVFGQEVFAMFQKEDGYKVIGIYPVSEAMTPRDINIYMNAFCQILVFAFLFAAVFFGINTVVVKRVKKINASLEKITAGNLDEVVDVNDSQELATLSGEINTTVDRLKEYIAEAAARIDQELEFAKNIQLSALPSRFPAFPDVHEFDIYASMDAAKEVGGDFYDFYIPENDKLAFLIADVSGKGIPAAMFMMQAKTMINGFISAGFSVNDTFEVANTKLCNNNDAEMFVTAWQGILDINTGHIDFANAGHNPPLVYRDKEGWSYLRSKVGFVLAGMEGIKYKLQSLDLNPGDKIFLYTDGIVEAQNISNELYGEERLLNYLNEHTTDSPKATIKGVKASVDEFAGEADQFDDMTMLLIEFNGPSTIIEAG